MEILKTLYATVESEAFRQEAQIINNLATLTHTINTNKSVKEFIDYFSLYPAEGARALKERVLKLLAQPSDSRYLNKYDAALAAYLYLLNEINRAESKLLMSQITLLDNTWWSAQMLLILKKKEDSKKTVYKVQHIQTGRVAQAREMTLDSTNSATANIKGVFA